MKNPTVLLVIRILLGLALLVFGINKFLHFMPMPPLPEAAGAFMGAMADSGYFIQLVGATQVVVGLLLLLNKYTALALVIIAPVVLNMFLFHAFLDLPGIGAAALLFILTIILLFANKDKYADMLAG